MKSIKRYFFCLLAALFLPISGFCTSGSSLSSAEEVVAIIFENSEISAEREEMLNSFDEFVSTLNVRSDQKQIVKRYRDQYIQLLSSAMQHEAAKESLTKIYREKFSEEELHQLLKFYKTSLGKKVLNVSVLANNKIQADTRVYVENILKPKLNKLFGDLVSELSSSKK